MAEFPSISTNQSVMGGRACLRGTEITVSTVLALMATGRSQQEIAAMFPTLTANHVREALAYAAWWVDEPEAESIPHAASVIQPVPPFVSKEAASTLETPELVLPPPLETPIEGIVQRETRSLPRLVKDEETLELFHPSIPDQPTVVVTRHGLFDRRWSTTTIAWCDIQEIRRVSGSKSIHVTLRNPHVYVSSMPFFKRLFVRLKLGLRRRAFHLDTASLGIRTRDIYLMTNRLWLRHRGKLRFRKKRRIRTGAKPGISKNQRLWGILLPS